VTPNSSPGVRRCCSPASVRCGHREARPGGRPGSRFVFRLPVMPGEVPVFADRELILTCDGSACRQRHSSTPKPESPDRHRLRRGRETERGLCRFGARACSSHASTDRERVFLSDSTGRPRSGIHLPAGTGLGLSIVRQIVAAHHGQCLGRRRRGTTARRSLLSLPGGARAVR
jgi:hypothetical protein